MMEIEIGSSNQIINLPKDLDKATTHRYGPNIFKLHRLPVPRPGQVFSYLIWIDSISWIIWDNLQI
ncbi:hypothetical protein MKX03_027878, partial [Papaver bracteatum]